MLGIPASLLDLGPSLYDETEAQGMKLPKLATLADRVIWRRKDLKLTQTELANRAGATRVQIQKIENGKTIRPRNMERIATALEVSQAWLLFGYEELESLSEDSIAMAVQWESLPPEIKKAILAVINSVK